VAKPRVKTEPSDASPPAADSPLSFEASIAALGQLVEQLERGDLPLEESLNLFERGIRLSKDAQAILDKAEQRIETLLGFDDQQNPITTEPESNGPR
jgi:exodeoxyribonuclease VII small subunit